jgi:hypothetical protein
MNPPVNDSPDIHAMAYDKDQEVLQSLYLAQRWQQQEADAVASACKYLTQAANNEVPHD